MAHYANITHVKGTEKRWADGRVPDFAPELTLKPVYHIVADARHPSVHRLLQGPDDQRPKRHKR